MRPEGAGSCLLAEGAVVVWAVVVWVVVVLAVFGRAVFVWCRTVTVGAGCVTGADNFLRFGWLMSLDVCPLSLAVAVLWCWAKRLLRCLTRLLTWADGVTRDADLELELELVLFPDEVLDDEGSEEADDWELESVWVRDAAARARVGDMRNTFRGLFSHVG